MLIDRIKEVVRLKKMSARKFSEAINFNYTTLNNYFTGTRKTIDATLLEKMASTFEDVNYLWLLTGRGSMLREDQPSNQTTLPVQSADNSFLLNMYKEERAKSDAQAEEIGALKQQVKTLEKQLEDLGFGETSQQEASVGSTRTRKSGVAELGGARFADQSGFVEVK